MLIWLDSSISSALTHSTTDTDAGFREIFQAIYRSEHIVLADRELLNQLSANNDFSLQDRKLLAALAKRITSFGDIEQYLSHKLAIVHDDGPILRKVATGWEIQLGEIGRKGIHAATVLGEDISDVQLYTQAARHYLQEQKLLGSIVPHVDERMAGGKGNTLRQFALLLKSAKFWCLCITDSDKLTHLCGEHPLSRRLKSLAEHFETSAISKNYVLPVRELENIIPHNLTSRALENIDFAAFSAWQDLLDTRTTPIHIVDHSDLKKGTSLHSIKKLDQESIQRKSWDDEIIRLQAKGFINVSCKHATCPREQNKLNTCECIVTPVISENIAGNVAQYIQENSIQKTLEAVKSSGNKEHWFELGKIVASWTCGPRTRLI
jgi:hypothetical protein